MTTGSVLAHVGSGIAMLGLGGYFASQSNQHMRRAKWATATIVQLHTFDAYTAPMTNEQRESMREFLGRRLFSEPPWATEGGGDSDTSTKTDVSDLLVAELIANLRRGNSQSASLLPLHATGPLGLGASIGDKTLAEAGARVMAAQSARSPQDNQQRPSATNAVVCKTAGQKIVRTTANYRR